MRIGQQPINKTVADNALAEFCESINYDSLRGLPCAACSGLYP
ncbi:7937_t:CDS:1, partial [Diversispora eburnea]